MCFTVATTDTRTPARRSGLRRVTNPPADSLVASPSGIVKAAELASALGAVVLGAGLALVAPEGLRLHAVPLLITGLLVHGTGMTLKHRLQGQAGPLAWWDRALFWLCGAALAALGLWLATAWAQR